MVYKKYVRINGKLHGPYYYESYREGGKVKKRYLGTSPPGGNKDSKNTKAPDGKPFVPRKSLRFVWVLAILFLLVIVALFLRPTGNVVLQINEDSYRINDSLTGGLAVLMEVDDLVQKDVEVILSLSKEGVVLSEVSMTLEEYINGQVEPVEVTQITESCQDITEESVEGVCYNETVSSEMEEVCTEEEVCVNKTETETKEVCTEEEVCVDKITTETKEVCTEEGEETVCHDEDVEVVEEECESEETCSEEMVEVVEEECDVQEECTNETVSKTKEICENQVVQNVVGQDCVKETTTDYYYNVSGEYLRDIEELMDYTFNETGRYVLTFSVPSLGVSEEKILVLGGLFEVQEFVVSFSGGGDGSAGDPFQITNCTQLQEMEDNLTAYYIITQDVDCSDTPNWNSGAGFVPVGNGSDKFLGNFDGQNNTVTGLFINSSLRYVGLFGFIGLGPNISDVGLVNISIISNYTQGSVGGFTGRFSGNNKISNSYITGNLTSESESGGFVGATDGSGSLEINNSYFEGSVYSTYYYVGGLVGYSSGSGPVNISNSYSAGLVNTTINDLGGLVGVFYGNIVNTFTSTNVTGDGAYDGSVVGEYNGVFTNVYWNNHSNNPDNCTAASGNPSGCNIVQDNDAYFHSSSNAPMSSWDFTNVWQEESGDYPTLRSFGEAAPSPPPCDVNISECKTSGWSDNTYYCLNQSVNTTVHCMTIDAKNVTLDCQGYNLTGDRTASPSNDYGINASGFNSTTIKNCVVSNFHYGTYFTYVNHVSFENNTANNNSYYGFYLQYSDYNNLTDNVAENHTNNGIDLRTSDNNVLTNNTMSNNNVGSSSTGLYMVSSYNNTLTGNEMYNNTFNFRISGSTSEQLNHSVDTSNLVEGKPVYYIKNAENTEYDSSTNAGTFYCINCNNITVRDLSLTGNYYGVFFFNTSNSSIVNVSSIESSSGISLYQFNYYNTIDNCTLNNNRDYGIEFDRYNSYNNITNTVISYGLDYGISFSDECAHNRMVNNTLIYNSGGIFFDREDANNSVVNNNISHNTDEGIFFDDDSVNNLVIGNEINNNTEGIELGWGSNNNTIISNTITRSVQSGVYIHVSTMNNTFTDNKIEYNGRHGIWITSDSINNTFTDTRVCYNNQSGGDYYDIYDLDGGNWSVMTCDTSNGTANCSYICDGIDPNITEFNVSYGSTNFSAEEDLTQVLNLTLATQYGKIQFPTDYEVNAYEENYDEYVEIGDDFISVNTTELHATFNSSANLTINDIACPIVIFYGDGVYTSAQDIISEGNVCNDTTEPNCTNINCTDNNLSFTVNHFTGFGAKSDLPPEFSNAVNYSSNFARYYNFTANITIREIVDGIDSYVFATDANGTWVNRTTVAGGVVEYNASESANISTSNSTVCWYYWANDTEGKSNQSANYCFDILVHAPNLTRVIINTTSGFNHSGDDLICWANATDLDDPLVKYTTYWYEEGVKQVDVWNVTAGQTGGASAFGYGVTTDSERNVIVTGSYGSPQNFWTIKYYPNGTAMWNVTRDGGLSGGYGEDVAVDSNDSVIVAGYKDWDFHILKYNSSGSFLWAKTYDKGGSEEGKGVTVDSQDNIIVTGFSGTSGWTLKLNNSGDEIWNVTTAANNFYDVEVDNQDDIIVVGIWNSLDMSTYKYNSSGSFMWSDTEGGADQDYAYGVATDSSDNVLVTGTDRIGSNYNITTIQYNSSGSLIWNKTIGAGDSRGRGVDVDSENNVFVAGQTDAFGAGNDDAWIIKYNSSGDLQWNRTIGGSVNDYGRDVAVDNEDNVVLAGYTSSFGVSDVDFLTVRYYYNILRDQPQGALVNTSTIDSSEVEYGSNWSCEVEAYAGTTTVSLISDNVTISNPYCGDLIDSNISFGYNISCSGSIAALNITTNGTGIDCQGNKLNNSDFVGIGIYMALRSGVVIENCQIDDFDIGIYMVLSNNNTIRNNSFSDNREAIYIDDEIAITEGSNDILSNVISDSDDLGIHLRGTRNNLVKGNRVTGGGVLDYGIYINTGYGIAWNNTIYDNYFNNTNNAYDDAGYDLWNTTKTSGTNIINRSYIGGNFWDDYTGADNGTGGRVAGDGLGDTELPYDSNGNILAGGDYLPLVYNELPAIVSVFVSSSLGTNYTTENLTCWANATDLDFENLAYNGSWYKDGAENLSFASGSHSQGLLVNLSTIDSSYTSVGEKWSCRARAYDGEDYSAYGVSDNLTIASVPVSPPPVGGGGGGGISRSCGDVDYGNCSWTSCQPINGAEGIREYVCYKIAVCTGPNTIVEDTENCTIACAEDWECEWTSCANGTSTYECSDVNECGTEDDKPLDEGSEADCSKEFEVAEEEGEEMLECTPDIKCGEWSTECKYSDRTEDVMAGEIRLTGVRERECRDSKGCVGMFTGTTQCTSDIKVELTLEDVCDRGSLIAVNAETGKRLVDIDMNKWEESGLLDVAFMQWGDVYCPACYNGVQDGKEEGVDCGGGDCKDCRAERYIIWPWYFIGGIVLLLLVLIGSIVRERAAIAKIKRLLGAGYDALEGRDVREAISTYEKIKPTYYESGEVVKKQTKGEIIGYHKRTSRFIDMVNRIRNRFKGWGK